MRVVPALFLLSEVFPMKFKSPIITQASGSLGGSTYSRNKGGMYIRSRAIPTNPGSTFQSAVRAVFAELTNAWIDELSEAQRLVWQGYANNVQLIDKLGDPTNVTGLNMYVRSNVPRLQAGLPRVDTGPIVYDLGNFTAPQFAIDTANDEVDVTFTAADAWANEDDASMLVFASRPQNVTINYFKGPYRLAGMIDGDSTTPPTSPAAISLPFAVEAGQRIFTRVAVSRADGRLSYPFRDQADAA